MYRAEMRVDGTRSSNVFILDGGKSLSASLNVLSDDRVSERVHLDRT